jgi:hypothetical protein
MGLHPGYEWLSRSSTRKISSRSSSDDNVRRYVIMKLLDLVFNIAGYQNRQNMDLLDKTGVAARLRHECVQYESRDWDNR